MEIKNLKNFTSSLFNHSLNLFKNVDSKTKNKRLEICATCEHLKDGGACNLCGCFLQIKTSWASEKCPIDKWKSELSSENNPTDQPIAPSGDCGCNKK